MAIKDKKYYHNLDLLKNELKNALVKIAPSESHDIVNLESLNKSFIYDTAKAISIKNVYTTVGGLTAGTDVSDKTLKELFDLIFFTSTDAIYTYPIIRDSIISISNSGSVIKSNSLGGGIIIDSDVDYDGDITIDIKFNYDKNDGGDLESIILNGTDFISNATELNGEWNLSLPLKDVMTSSSMNAINISIVYKEGDQKLDEEGNPSGTPLPSGSMVFNDAIVFKSLGYPIFTKVLNLLDFIKPEFNYQTDGVILPKNGNVSISKDKVLVIGIPVSNVNPLTILHKSINTSDKFIKRQISISSNKSQGGIPYNLYYYFANTLTDDITIGYGKDLSIISNTDLFTWVGVQGSLKCLNQGIDESAKYLLAELMFGGILTSYIIENDNKVPNTTSSTCKIVTDFKTKLVDLSNIRYPSLAELYDNIKNSEDAENALSVTEEVYVKLEIFKLESTDVGFGIFKTIRGYSILEIKSDLSYEYHEFNGIDDSKIEWKPVLTTGTCEIKFGNKTGKFVYTTLEKYINDVATGITKDNLSSDTDFIDGKLTASCLNLSELGIGIDNDNNKYQNKITADNNLDSDITTLLTSNKIKYYTSINNGKCYKEVNGVIELAKSNFEYFTLVKIIDSYYKILKVSNDSTWQYFYYENNQSALVPTLWIGDKATGTCTLNINGINSGFMHYNDIYEIYTDNQYNIRVNDITKPNGTDGHNVADELSDACKSNLEDVESLTYDTLISKINNSNLARNKRYIISDFRTVSTWSNSLTSNTVYGEIEPIIVLAVSVNKLSSIAYSTIHSNDLIHYNPLNVLENKLYTGSERGVITKRIDTVNNIEFDFDFRGLRSGSSTRLNTLLGEFPLVVSYDTLIKSRNSKVSLSHNSSQDNITGSSVIFEKCAIINSNVTIDGSINIIFSEITSGATPLDDDITMDIINSNFKLTGTWDRLHTYANGTPTQRANRNDDNFFVGKIINSNISTQFLCIGTQTGGKPTIENSLSNFNYNGLALNIWKIPFGSVQYNSIFGKNYPINVTGSVVDGYRIPLTLWNTDETAIQNFASFPFLDPVSKLVYIREISL